MTPGSNRHRISEAKRPAAKPQPAPQENRPQGQWGVSFSSIFKQSLVDCAKVFPDIEAKVEKFFSVKLGNPLSSPYGKHDRPMTGPLAGLWHCHLRDDAVLIYRLKNHCIHLVMIVAHADIEGKRQRHTMQRLANVGELPETRGLADRITVGVLPLLEDHGLTDTPSFKRWFDGSLVIDDQGRPLQVYHGTANTFSSFYTGSHFGSAKAANQRIADRRSGRMDNEPSFSVMPVYLRITNPLEVPDYVASNEASLLNYVAQTDEQGRIFPEVDLGLARREGVYTALKAAGYDGLVYENECEDRGHRSWVVFEPNRVKSALSNEGQIPDHVGIKIGHKYCDVRGAGSEAQFLQDCGNVVKPVERDLVLLHCGLSGAAPPYATPELRSARAAVKKVYGR